MEELAFVWELMKEYLLLLTVFQSQVEMEPWEFTRIHKCTHMSGHIYSHAHTMHVHGLYRA